MQQLVDDASLPAGIRPLNSDLHSHGSVTVIAEEVRSLYRHRLTSLELLTLLELMLTHCDGQHRPVVVAAMAETFGTYPANISRALERLVEVGAVLKGDKKCGRSYTYLVNPLLAQRGQLHDHISAHPIV